MKFRVIIEYDARFNLISLMRKFFGFIQACRVNSLGIVGIYELKLIVLPKTQRAGFHSSWRSFSSVK